MDDLRKLAERAEERLRRMGEEIAMREERKYSVEIIRRYRQMDFRRAVIERVEVGPATDRVTLECGHSDEMLARLVDVLAAGKAPLLLRLRKGVAGSSGAGRSRAG